MHNSPVMSKDGYNINKMVMTMNKMVMYINELMDLCDDARMMVMTLMILQCVQ